MIKSGLDKNHYGPYMLYYGPAWTEYFNDEYKAESDDTLADRLRRIDQVDEVKMIDLLDGYDSLADSGRSGFYIHSPKIVLISSMTFGIPIDDPRWDEITQGLEGGNNQVYDNGQIQIYSSGR